MKIKVEVHEIEERKNQHINELMINHDLAFKEMKEYYNSITRDNIGIIKQLREQIADVKVKTAENESSATEAKTCQKALLPSLANVK